LYQVMQRGLFRILVSGLASLLIFFAIGCSETTRPNVLFIVVDTLRSDHLGSYGYERETSPSIDALAADAVRFERSYAPAPWTKPSVASMISGLYPSGHAANSLFSGLAGSIETLPEILQDAGYATASVVSSKVLTAKIGFRQGYESHDRSAAHGGAYDSTPGVTEKSIELIEKLSREERPFFLFVHYFDPHYTYQRHPDSDFAAERAGRIDGTEKIGKLRKLLGDMTDEEVALLVDLYDEEIRFTDAGIGRLLDRLRELGLYDDTLIVLTADHGEEFLEHGWLGHTQNLYEAVVRVPLIIREPSLPHGPRVVAKPVSLVSLVATILELAGVDSLQRRFHEPSLVPELRGERDETHSVVFMEVDFEGYSRKKTAFKKAIVLGDLKLIRDDLTGAMEIYDLAADPQERNNLAVRHPELREKLAPLLERSIRRSGSAPVDAWDVEFSSEEIEDLRALGYVEP